MIQDVDFYKPHYIGDPSLRIDLSVAKYRDDEYYVRGNAHKVLSSKTTGMIYSRFKPGDYMTRKKAIELVSFLEKMNSGGEMDEQEKQIATEIAKDVSFYQREVTIDSFPEQSIRIRDLIERTMNIGLLNLINGKFTVKRKILIYDGACIFAIGEGGFHGLCGGSTISTSVDIRSSCTSEEKRMIAALIYSILVDAMESSRKGIFLFSDASGNATIRKLLIMFPEFTEFIKDIGLEEVNPRTSNVMKVYSLTRSDLKSKEKIESFFNKIKEK